MSTPKPTKEAIVLFHEGINALNRASQYGMPIDVEYCEDVSKKLDKRLKALKQNILTSSLGKFWSKIHKNININSDQQLANILFSKLKFPVIKETEKGNPSVNAEVLEILKEDRPEIQYINDYRKIYVAQNTFIKGFLREQVNGLLHPNYNLNVARSFRSTSSNPNFQNNPKRDKLQKKIVRKAIIPRPGRQIVAMDFGGIEVRVAACVTGDEKLKYDAVHGDMHRDLAVECYLLDDFEKKGSEKTLRNGAKNGFVFPQFYGDYYGNNAPSLLKWGQMPTDRQFKENEGLLLLDGVPLGKHLINKGIRNPEQFTKHIQKIENSFWKDRYKTYGKWKEAQIKKYHKEGFLKTITGFVCTNIMFKNDITNYPIQGPAFHCLLKAFVEAEKQSIEEEWMSGLIGQIHDEMVWDAEPSETKLLLERTGWIMKEWLPKQWPWIDVELEVEADVYPVDGSWAEEPETVVL